MKTSKSAKKRPTRRRRWSARVTRTSDAMDLEKGIFKSDDPKRIARSVKRSAQRSRRRKASPQRSALSMITFYENRAGNNLSARKRRTLDRAKTALKREK
jgi:hypothetical protein